MPLAKSPSTVFDALLKAEAEGSPQAVPPRIAIIRASLDGGSMRDVSPGQVDIEDDSLMQLRGGDLAKKVMGLDSADLDDVTAPGAMLRSLLGDLLIDYSMLSEMEQIGEGGFATVYKAELTHRNGMKQTVAVKCLKPERVQCDEDLKEFIAEGNLWRKLQSKDVVKLMGIGAEDLTSIPAIRKSFFIVCEHLNGPTLRGIVQKQSFCTKKDVYSTKDVFRWFIGIARGVKYLHSCRPAIIHRDLKPENVLLTSADISASEAKVLDLGLHIRGRARSIAFGLSGDREKSYYGGDNYDAVALNGSVRAGRSGTGQTLKEKCLTADLASPFPMGASPPATNTRHGSVTGGEALGRIAEHDENCPSSSDKNKGAAPEPDDSLKGTSNNTTPKSTDDNSPCTDPQRKRSQKSTARVDGAQTPTRTGLKHVMSDASIASRLSTEDVPHTAKVGSWMYMAPEMVTSHHYTEKVDVFAMSVMLYEALKCRLNVTRIAIGGEPGALKEYADTVASGFREEIPNNWPSEIVSLIKDGWHQDPSLRITAAEFLLRVSNLMESNVPDIMDEVHRKHAEALTGCMGQCGCSIM